MIEDRPKGPAGLGALAVGMSALGLTLMAGSLPAGALDLAGQPPGELRIERNRGQMAPGVEFLVRARGYLGFLGSRGVHFRLAGESPGEGAVVAMQFVGADSRPGEGREVLSGRSHYFVGDDPATWIRDVSSYRRVVFEEVYPGVDLVYRSRAGDLEYDLVAAPGADLDAIRLRFEGADRVALAHDGALVLSTSAGELRVLPPFCYQGVDGQRELVAARYVARGESEVGLELARYDAQRPLVVDPVIRYSTPLGGFDHDLGHSIAVAADGSAYVVGQTLSPDFPTSEEIGGDVVNGYVAYVAKLNPAGSAAVYTTFIGGTNAFNVTFDQLGIAVDATGAAYITGKTRAPDFPTMHPIQGQPGGGFDAFISKLSPDGSSLVYSTYLGGAGEDFSRGVALDAAGHLYVVGQTTSSDFPTVNPLQAQNAGGFDAFVAKLDPSGSSLVYSTYYGGSGSGDPRFGDLGYDIALDPAGSAYITGLTDSPDLPLQSPLQANLGGGDHDAFVAKFATDGSAIEYATYLGGDRNEEGLGIAVRSGSAYVTGWTSSTDFPTVGALQSAPAGSTDLFISRLAPDGSALEYSTYFGGSAREYSFDIAVGAGAEAWVAGVTESVDLPTADPVQASLGGGSDSFVLQLSGDGSSLLFSSYLGGSADEDFAISGFGIALDGAENVYLTGSTASSDFPTVAPLQPIHGGMTDAYVTKLGRAPEVLVHVEDVGGSDEFRISLANGSAEPRSVQLRYWAQLDGSTQALVSATQVLTLPALQTFTLASHALPGGATFPEAVVGARLLDPVTGDVLSQSICSVSPCN